MGAAGMAPRCSLDDPASCVTYCHLSGDGELMCEGVPEGTYTVHRAAAADIEVRLSVDVSIRRLGGRNGISILGM